MNLKELRNKHFGKSAFCLGTAPHLNQIDLSKIKDCVSIGCNQLINDSDKYKLDYICFKSSKRYDQFKDSLSKYNHPTYIVPESILRKYPDRPKDVQDRLVSVNLRLTSREHTEFFSFDLENCIYADDSLALEIQLAVWLGCKVIYLLGVDGKVKNLENPYYDESIKSSKEEITKYNDYYTPDMVEWLGRVKHLLWTRNIRLYNAAGDLSALEIIPKVRYPSSLGKHTIGVTSKTFSKDDYLVRELKRYFPTVKLNNSSEKLEGDKLVDFLIDCDGMILGTEPFTQEVMKKLPCLRYVSKYGVGLNNIDFKAIKEFEIDLTYRKGVNSDSVAELTLAFTLMLLRKIDNSIQGYRTNNWSKLPGKELSEITVGLIGYGNVGKVVAQKFAALNVGRILVNDIVDIESTPPIEPVNLEFLLSESDIISLHISGEERNHKFVNANFLKQIKPGSALINTSRGEVVDEKALVKSLKKGLLSGAALDVYQTEPQINQELNELESVLTTCHIAGSSNRAIKNMGWAAIEGLMKLFNIEE